MVGVDGSADSVAALRDAAWAAAARGALLVVVTAWSTQETAGAQDAARDCQEQAVTTALGANPLVDLERIITAASPVDALVSAARGANLLVVGTRGHSGLAGWLLGSVSMACVARAACPVLVVHHGEPLTDDQEGPTGARVVVGVGDDDVSVEVLRAAAAVAAELEAELLAVSSWQRSFATTRFAGLEPRGDLDDATRRTAEQDLARRIHAAFGADAPGRLRSEVRQGTPAAVLIEASATADVVVIGRATRNRWTVPTLGSATLPIAEHARCSVLVVPALVVPASAGGAPIAAETAGT